jgi:hypothetical protein
VESIVPSGFAKRFIQLTCAFADAFAFASSASILTAPASPSRRGARFALAKSSAPLAECSDLRSCRRPAEGTLLIGRIRHAKAATGID